MSLADWNQLLHAAAAGDRDSYDQLCRESTPLLREHAHQVLRNPDDAQDVVQEALFEVWRLGERYDPARGHARSWLITMTRRRAIDRVRRVSAARDREDRFGRQHLPVDHDSTADSVVDLLDRASVRGGLHHLSDLQREAMLLVYYEGCTSAQAAARLDISIGTLKTRVRDGVTRLRSVLDTTG